MNIETIELRGGKREGAGRPSKLRTQVKDFIKEYPQAVEALMVMLYERGIKGDVEAAKYVIDRIKGKPKSTIGIDEGDGRALAALAFIELIRLQDQELIEGDIDAIQITGTEDGSQQAKDAEDA